MKPWRPSAGNRFGGLPALRCCLCWTVNRSEGLTIRAALLLGFGLTFGIWLFAGYSFTKRIGEVEGRASAINTRYTRAQELLATVRAQVLLGSVYVRDALLDPDPATAGEYGASWRRPTRPSIRRCINTSRCWIPGGAGACRAPAAGDRRLSRHDARVLDTDSRRWPTDARVLLRTQIVPKRELVIRVSEEVQALNRGAFVQQQKEIAEIYGAAQRRLWGSLGLALAASFGIALLATLYAGRLENRIRQQRHTGCPECARAPATVRQADDGAGRRAAQYRPRAARRGGASPHRDQGRARGGAADDGSQRRPVTPARGRAVHHRRRDAPRCVILSHLLHPALLDDLGLPAAVEWYLRSFGRRHDIRVEVLHDRMEERLTPEIESVRLPDRPGGVDERRQARAGHRVPRVPAAAPTRS